MTERYAVGLDVGDGESCIAWVSVDELAETPLLFHMAESEASVVSAYAQLADETYILGEQALLAAEAEKVNVNFKNRPKFSERGVAPLMKAPVFANLFWREFEMKHPEVANDCKIYVGCPAGWNEKEIQFYQRKLAENLEPRPVKVVPESQSAFIYVHDATMIDPGTRPVLVVDVGSSTTDFTLVEDEPDNLGFGDGLGCRDIDAALRDAVIALVPDPGARERLMNERSSYEFLVWLCRHRKEAAYQGTAPERPAGTGHREWVLDTYWDTLVAYDVPALVDREWRPRLLGELTAVREYLGQRKPRLVLTTGGGSRMPFVAELCREIFSGSDVDPDLDEPAFTVARGLASYGRWRHRVDLFRTKVEGLADSDDIDNIVRRDASGIAYRFSTVFYTRYNHWLTLPDEAEAGAGINQPISTAEMHRQFVGWLDSPQGERSRTKILGPFEKAIQAELIPRASELCREFGLDSYSLTINIRLPSRLAVQSKFPILDQIMDPSNAFLWNPLLVTRNGQLYVRTADFVDRIGEFVRAPLMAWLFKLDDSQLRDLAAIVRNEVRSQLIERVQPIERLLIGVTTSS